MTETVQVNEFALEGGTLVKFDEAEYITRSGKIFEVGDYPDKDFSISAEEIKAAVAGFAPVQIDLEHRPSVLSNKLGQLTEVKLADNGKDLLGTVSLPAWLDKLLEDGKRKVSCTWDRATKKLVGLALVNHPRVSDAALLSAFSADFAGKRNNASDQKTIQAIHDHTSEMGADCKPPKYFSDSNSNNDNKENLTMTEKPKDEGQVAAPDNTAEFSAMKTRMEALEAANKKLREDKIKSEAEAFADKMVREGKALPAEKLTLVAAFVAAAEDDEARPLQVTFAQGKTGTRVDMVKAIYEARQSNGLLGELTQTYDPDKQQASFGQQQTQPGKLSAEKREELLNATPLGQRALHAVK